jgi:hypothetical protein
MDVMGVTYQIVTILAPGIAEARQFSEHQIQGPVPTGRSS